ncbi:hypothetical protein BCY89_27205 [Sphingobacterium siyangense]|uniref:Uncharacterized protein n=1 Tax=Sphingobacterium siyangense TaxID=459529 RepID=A0A420G002_9SPHI|nr:hypothetical protein BCY89_27205 [Sphingobacterium siyangense]
MVAILIQDRIFGKGNGLHVFQIVIIVIQLTTLVPQLRKGIFDNLNIGMEANIPAPNGILFCLALIRI